MLSTTRQVAFPTNKSSFGTMVSMYVTLNGPGSCRVPLCNFFTASELASATEINNSLSSKRTLEFGPTAVRTGRFQFGKN